uniref:Uncharacterized protein n=1 Tax=Steinernema glaseri TaxID=37863 RepID=A0A1I7ZM79_9BILA
MRRKNRQRERRKQHRKAVSMMRSSETKSTFLIGRKFESVSFAEERRLDNPITAIYTPREIDVSKKRP